MEPIALLNKFTSQKSHLLWLRKEERKVKWWTHKMSYLRNNKGAEKSIRLANSLTVVRPTFFHTHVIFLISEL